MTMWCLTSYFQHASSTDTYTQQLSKETESQIIAIQQEAAAKRGEVVKMLLDAVGNVYTDVEDLSRV